jgi:Holliday junction DNA helicase RuvB
MGRTPRGRIAMPGAWEHLGLAMPKDAIFASAQTYENDED